MPLTALQKGKGKALPGELAERTASPGPSASSASGSPASSSYSSSSESDSEDDSESSEDNSESEGEVTEEYLNSLLQKARESIAANEAQAGPSFDTTTAGEEEIINWNLPPLDPGPMPPSYITLGKTLLDAPLAIRDFDAEQIMQSSSSTSAPAPPIPPPELTNSGKPLTKKEKKALKEKTAGPGWFDLPAPAEADLPRLHKEYEALRLRNQLDPKRFYRKDPGESRGIKGLPKHFAIGTIVPTNTPFGGPSGDNLPRSARKRTLVDELVDDAEARHYAKRKFNELQSSRAAKGRGTLAARKAARKPKW
ncbi:Fcf2 pre-rRNA processing-domain-containing protein [Gloeopeniophorella convolvens]|nr:Fcf2 pre-rRNA processing-domain-containing protein [Gloeopeniophorella convolvens]